jgi:nicotinate-nucleotide--dimethylbenzimidazole phosphoribosyltransferase
MFAEISETLIPEPDAVSGGRVRTRASQVIRPAGALSRLDELAIWLAEWQRTDRPSVDAPLVVVFAGDHGVTTEGVSAYPQEVTRAMVEAIAAGVATVSVMAQDIGARLELVDLDVGNPTGNLRIEAAMSVEDAVSAFEMGRRAIDGSRVDLLIPAEVGIGNTTAAAALCLALWGGDVDDWVGAGTGLDEAGVTRKRRVVADAVARIPSSTPVFEIARQLGGRELLAIAGTVEAARRASIPVLLDGFVTTAAAMILEAVRPGYLDHCWPGHLSPEPGHRRLLERLGRPPILDLEMRLGEGSGALAAVPVVRIAAKCVTDVATFEEQGLV